MTCEEEEKIKKYDVILSYFEEMGEEVPPNMELDWNEGWK